MSFEVINKYFLSVFKIKAQIVVKAKIIKAMAEKRCPLLKSYDLILFRIQFLISQIIETFEGLCD
jgi:hypothetical protein